MTSKSSSGGVKRVWPAGTDYARAIQTPEISFSDPELAAGKPGTNALGMPLVASGQNAVVFLLKTKRRSDAVRCFLTPPSEGAVRYLALQDHLVDSSPPALTPARWLADGIMVGQTRWPVVVMPWVDGAPLNLAVEAMIGDSERLRELARRWAEVVLSLQSAGIAHGDLQHGNVLIAAKDAIALVDLDGVWVPEIEIGPPAEFGHPNYQHPKRDIKHWGRYVDSFPGALIELAILGLAADASLKRFLHGENLLFMRADLERSADSEVWDALCTSPEPTVAQMAATLRQFCAGPIASVLVPFDELRTTTNETLARTVVRPSQVKSPVAAPSPIAAVPDDDSWWEKPAKSAPAPEPRSVLLSSDAAAKPSRSMLVGLGKNAAISGLTGGALAGVMGSCATVLFDPFLSERGETIAFVALIGVMLGGFLLSMQSIAGQHWRAAARRFLLGALVGGTAGTLAIPVANAAVVGLATGEAGSREVPLGATILIFVIVASFVGFALGMLRSGTTGLYGAAAGAAGGLVGGAVFGKSVAKYDGSAELDVLFLSPLTMFVVALVTGAIGLSYGLTVRARRFASLTIIEGLNSGMEIAVEGEHATIGADSGCDLILRNDPKVSGKHAELLLTSVPPVLVPIGVVLRNGEAIADRVQLASGDVLMIGGSYIRIDFKEAQDGV